MSTPDRARRLPWLLGGLFALVYAALALARYRGFFWSSWDLAIFTEVVSHFGHLQEPVAEVKGAGFDFLGDHFSPILAVLAPAYRLFPSAATLLVAHSLLLGWSVVPVARLALRRLGATAATIVGVSYGLSFGLAQAVQVDFHEIVFAVPLVAFAAAALVEERWRAAVAWSVPLVLVKEDLGATVAVIGLLVWAPWRGSWRGPWTAEERVRRRTGLAMAAFGVLASAVTVFVLIPYFAHGQGYEYFSKFGGDDGDWSAGWGTRAQTAGRLLLLTVAVALRSPVTLLVLPTLAWRFASTNPLYWGTDWHYDAVLMPILFIALVDGVVRLRDSRRPLLRGWGAAALPLALAVAVGSLPWSPLRQLTQPVLWRDSAHRAALRHAVDLVPKGVSVQSDLGALSHLAGRSPAYWIGTTGVTPTYVVIDANTGWGAPGPGELPAYVTRTHDGTKYRLVWSEQGVSVLRRAGG